ncbi:hypothetical protein [Weissella soli]|uniref:hypothetical protein n=1 Tax=Weissella soli TaxID=155866 RepID=UPI00359F5E79
MLVSYQALQAGFNQSVPVALRLTDTSVDTVTVGDALATMTVFKRGDEVTKIIIETDATDEAIHATFYQLFVQGLEGGMQWSSSNYYHAMMATLADHGAHTGMNELGIRAEHVYQAPNRIVVTITR